MNANVLKLEKKHPTFTHTQDIIDICKPLKTIHITSFSHAKIHNEKSFSLLTSNPDFMKNYIHKEHYQADIVTSVKHSSQLNYILWDSVNAKGQTAEMLEDAAAHDYRHPVTIIKKIGSVFNAYTFGTEKTNDSANQSYFNNIDLLENFIDHYNQIIDNSTLLKSAHDFEFDNTKSAIFHESSLAVEQEKRNAFYNALSIDHPQFNITTRELDCIPLILSGLTMKEMASTLNISPRTIENHIISLKNKFNVRNKEALIIKLIKLNSHQLNRF